MLHTHLLEYSQEASLWAVSLGLKKSLKGRIKKRIGIDDGWTRRSLKHMSNSTAVPYLHAGVFCKTAISHDKKKRLI